MSTVTQCPLHSAHSELTVIDYLCLLWPQRARRVVHKLFANGAVRSGGCPVSPHRRVSSLDDLSIHVSLENVPTIYADVVPARETATLLEVLHEDARLVVVRKPSGLPVIPDRTRDVPSCLELLTRRELAARPEKDPGEYIRYRIVHRIDRMTSGLVIVAKTSEAERELCADFESRHVRKEYLALVRGRVSGSRIVVPGPIAPGRKGKMRWVSKDTPGAKDALTVFDVVERFAAATLVRAQPRTGRQHQIRVHAWAMGHPLAVDPLYAVGERAQGDPIPGIERLTLHAYRYTLAPHWEPPRSFVCPLDDDFAQAIERLRLE